MLVLTSCTMLVAAPIMMVGGVAHGGARGRRALVAAAVSVPALASVGFIVSRMVPGFRRMQVRIDAVNRVLREQISGMRVVRAFAREPYETTASAGPTPSSPTSRSPSGAGWR